MARNNRIAFTLVEMLVVIVIISMLVALLVPAVIGARARARRVSCMNKMDQAGKAIAQYEAAKGHLPGYVNQIGGGTIGGSGIASTNNLTWAVAILEYLGRSDLWRQWRKRPPAGLSPPRETNPNYTVVLEEYVCPSDTERRGKAGTLSFAVNCGISDERGTDVGAYETLTGSNTTYEQSAWGLFYDRDKTVPNGLAPTKPNPKMVAIGLDEIADGATQTIMLSENLNAGTWSSPVIDASGGMPVEQRNVGIVWWSAESSLPWASAVPGEVMINSEDPSMPPYKARPSSNHPGGVNAVFADNSAKFISDQVDYNVFRDQMISDQATARKYNLIP